MSRKRKNIENKNLFTLLREIKPKTENQSQYIRSIAECDITICSGPAGSGKTAVSVGLACEYLSSNKVQKIIITRPIVETGRAIGYLPGSFQDKIHPYLLPILDEMNMYFGPYETEGLIEEGIIEIAPLQYMRGRNFHRCFMLLDEAQNTTISEIKMFLTRLGSNSKCVINGDIMQSDIFEQNGLKICMEKLKDIPEIGIVSLTDADIIRNPVIWKVLERLK